MVQNWDSWASAAALPWLAAPLCLGFLSGDIILPSLADLSILELIERILAQTRGSITVSRNHTRRNRDNRLAYISPTLTFQTPLRGLRYTGVAHGPVVVQASALEKTGSNGGKWEK